MKRDSVNTDEIYSHYDTKEVDLYTNSNDSETPQHSLGKIPHIGKDLVMPPSLGKIPL